MYKWLHFDGESQNKAKLFKYLPFINIFQSLKGPGGSMR